MNSFDLSQSDNLPSMTIESLAFAKFSNVGEESGAIQKRFTNRERVSSGTNLIATLPMPEQLQFDSSWNWSVEERSLLQDFVSNFSDVKNMSMEDFKNAATNIAGRTSLSLDLFAGIGNKAGFAKNNLKEIFFDGVQNREFSWEWKFAPKSRKEYDDIKSFIREVKMAASPVKKIGALFQIPDSFQISFNNIDLPLVKECACTSVSDNYGDSGKVRIHNDGSPAFISLAMTFTEIDINDRKDF